MALVIDRVGKTYIHQDRVVVALDDVSVTIAPNEFFTLLGPSGCGKTTLLRVMAGFVTPESGHITLNGRLLDGLPPDRRPVNTVFQNYALFPHMTVRQNIAFGPEMKRRPAAEIRESVDRMLAMVGMADMANRMPAQLSGGQQQRVALARALVNRPDVLLLDEPLSALDVKLRRTMQGELKKLQHETGITFIFVTHDQDEALALSDRIAVMNGGRIEQIGTPADIYDRPANRFIADFIGTCNFVKGGDKITAFRPDHAVLCAAGQGRYQGTVVDVSYGGSFMSCIVNLATGERIEMRCSSHAAPAEGQSVGIAVDDRHIRTFDE